MLWRKEGFEPVRLASGSVREYNLRHFHDSWWIDIAILDTFRGQMDAILSWHHPKPLATQKPAVIRNLSLHILNIMMIAYKMGCLSRKISKNLPPPDLHNEGFHYQLLFLGTSRTQRPRCPCWPHRKPMYVMNSLCDYCEVLISYDFQAVIIQMFEWDWDSLATECTDFIGPAGYGYVQGVHLRYIIRRINLKDVTMQWALHKSTLQASI